MDSPRSLSICITLVLSPAFSSLPTRPLHAIAARVSRSLYVLSCLRVSVVMSNTVAPTTTMSSSYVPRNRDGSRPASPALSSSYRPRTHRPSDSSGHASPAPGSSTPNTRDGAGSRLKHELKEVQLEPEILVLDEATLQQARDILDVSLSSSSFLLGHDD